MSRDRRPPSAEDLAAQLGRPPSPSEVLAARNGAPTPPSSRAATPEEFAAERRRAMLQAGVIPPEHYGHAEPKPEPTMADASRGGCILGAAITAGLLGLFVLGFVLGRFTAPEPARDDRTRLAVCEVLDQLGADDTDGHVREFCP